MRYVVCYDLGDDRRRSRVATALLDFGMRVQESVFVADLNEELAGRMKERLTRLVDVDWDKVHIFEVCAACEKRAWTLGQGEMVHDQEWYIL